MYSQVDSYSLLSEIFDHKSDDTAVRKDDGFEVTKDGQQRHRRTTRGWKVRAGSSSLNNACLVWTSLKWKSV
jgi:hypothetical protein